MPDYYTTPGGIQYEELNSFPQMTGTREQFTLNTQWKIAGGDVWDLFSECFPEPTFGGVTIHSQPLQYPGRSWLYCNSLSVAPLGGEDQAPNFNSVTGYNSYDHLIATLQFGTVPWEEQTDSDTGDVTLRTVDVSFGGEYVNLQQYKLFWTTAVPGLNEIIEGDIGTGKIIPTIEYNVTLHNYAFFPINAVIDNLGKVNDTANQIIGHEDVETVLFVGASANRTITWRGTGLWQVGLRFSEKQTKHGADSYGWNYFWRPEKSEWQKVVDANDKVIFPTADLSELFKATA